MAVYSISGIVIIFIMIVLAVVLWKISKFLMFLLQIILFLALMFVVYKYCFTRENINKISSTVNHEKMQEYVDKASGSVTRMKNTIEKNVENKVQDAAAQILKDVREKPAAQEASAPAEKKLESESASSAGSGERREKAAAE